MTTGQTLYDATTTGSPTSSVGNTYDVWYRFTVPANVTAVQISVDGLGSSLNGNNMFIEVFNATACGSINTSTSIGFASAVHTNNSNADLTAMNLTPGAVYFFRVFTTTNPVTTPSTVWNFNVCITFSTTIPGNNECSAATTLTPGTTNTSGTLANATASTGIPVGCATGTPDDDVWYRFTAARTFATVTVIARSALHFSGAMIQVFSGSCGSLTSLACGKDAVNLTGLTVGTQYFIRVYSAGATGTGGKAGPSNPNATNFNISVSPGNSTTVGSGRMAEVFQQTNLGTENMTSDPWEVTYGPDDFLWITEAKGYRVFRMDPVTGARTTVLDLSRTSTFLLPGDTSFNMRYEINVNNPQGGLAGLAIHPDWATKKFVYVSYVHEYERALPNSAGIFYKNRIVRFTYNTSTGKLENPVSLCDTLPGSSDHNSQRMAIAPVDGVDYLFYAAGDLGAGQFGNAARAIKSQITGAYEGKILRFNLEPDGDAGTLDRWIPNDNPYNTTSPAKQNAVWCTGIRNNQGFAYANGNLYGSSHGPYSDDEINIIKRDRNYGHPLVIGYAADNNYNNSKAGHNNGADATIMPLIVNEANNASSIPNYEDPIFSAYAASQATVNGIYTNPVNNGAWPSEGWSGLDVYSHTLVPGWKNSLIAASLKWGRLVRMKMNETGNAIIPTNGFDTVSYFGGQNRFRDLAFAPNGKDIFVVMDRSTTSSGPSNANPVVPACPGCIQRYTFLGYNDASGKSSIPASIPVTTGVANNCNTGTPVTIDATNNNIWVPITGPDGNIMAEIFANGNNLGLVTSSFYTHSGPIRISKNVRYLNRNITITPQNQPSTAVGVRLYISKAELDALIAEPGSGVANIASLRILKNNDNCVNGAQNPSTLITPTFAEAHGTDGFVLQANISGFSSFYFSSVNFTLPLDLMTFTGTLQNNVTSLKWTTENEATTSHFIVERSVDGSRFTAIGKIRAKGNERIANQYSLLDADVMKLQSNTVYYRLAIVDKNNRVEYSNVVTIALDGRNSIVSVTPNPVSNRAQVRITSEQSGSATWQLVDNSGRTIQSGQLQLQRGNVNTFPINMDDLAQGTYYLQISGPGIQRREKLQKL